MIVAHTLNKPTIESREISAVAYGAAALPLAAIGVTFHVYLPKLLVDAGVYSATFIGLVFMVSRIWDAVLDPLMGLVSDEYKIFGYRRKFWFLACLPLGICSILIVSANGKMEFALLAFLFFLMWTALVVPYEALGAEWDLHENERLRVFSFREGGLILGTLTAAALPAIYESATSSTFDAAAAKGLMLIYVFLLVIALVWCALRVKEGRTNNRERARSSFKESVQECAKNRPFVNLAISSALHSLAAALPAVLVLFFVETVIESDKGSIFLCAYFLSGVVFLPLWNYLSKYASHKRLVQIAMIVQSVSFSLVAFLPAGAEVAFAVLVILSGVGYGGVLALFSALLVSCVDHGEKATGARNEGRYIGLWSVIKKGAIALGSGIALVGLGLSGHVAGSVEQSEAVVLMLRVLYAGVPLVLILLSVKFLSYFDLPQSVELVDE